MPPLGQGLVEGQGTSGWTMSTVPGARLLLPHAASMVGEFITVLTGRMQGLSVQVSTRQLALFDLGGELTSFSLDKVNSSLYIALSAPFHSLLPLAYLYLLPSFLCLVIFLFTLFHLDHACPCHSHLPSSSFFSPSPSSLSFPSSSFPSSPSSPTFPSSSFPSLPFLHFSYFSFFPQVK